MKKTFLFFVIISFASIVTSCGDRAPRQKTQAELTETANQIAAEKAIAEQKKAAEDAKIGEKKAQEEAAAQKEQELATSPLHNFILTPTGIELTSVTSDSIEDKSCNGLFPDGKKPMAQSFSITVTFKDSVGNEHSEVLAILASDCSSKANNEWSRTRGRDVLELHAFIKKNADLSKYEVEVKKGDFVELRLKKAPKEKKKGQVVVLENEYPAVIWNPNETRYHETITKNGIKEYQIFLKGGS